jgi:hypothetical protein
MTNLFRPDEPPQQEEVAKLCPFIGNMATPVMRESAIQKVGQPQMVGLEPKLFPCQGALCTFWSEADSKCKKLMEAEATVELLDVMKSVAKALAPLAKFMG